MSRGGGQWLCYCRNQIISEHTLTQGVGSSRHGERELDSVGIQEAALRGLGSVAHSCLTLCNPMNHSTPPPCPSPTPGVYPNSCPLSQWCHPTISSSVVPFSYCLQSCPASGSFLMSWLFISGSQSIGDSVLASVLPMNIQGWFP